MARFGYDHQILERFPSVVGGVIHAVGVSNGPASAELTAAFRAEQSSVLEGRWQRRAAFCVQGMLERDDDEHGGVARLE
jgi:hypothetical protein